MCHMMQASMGWRKPVHIQDLALTEPAALGGEQVVSIAKITSTKPLWDIVRGRDYDLVVSEPCVDCSLLPSGQVRLERLTQVRRDEASPGFQYCLGHARIRYSNGGTSLSQLQQVDVMYGHTR